MNKNFIRVFSLVLVGQVVLHHHFSALSLKEVEIVTLMLLLLLLLLQCQQLHFFKKLLKWVQLQAMEMELPRLRF